LVASSPDNLRNAIDAESQEVEKFTEFARQATEDGEEFYRGNSSGGLE
jgi:rubrerythrin